MKKARCQRKLVNSRRLNPKNGFDHTKQIQHSDDPSCDTIKSKRGVRTKNSTVKRSLSASPFYCAMLKLAANEACFIEIDSLIGKCFVLNNPHMAHRPISWDGSR
jgi:hypothetical protein